MPNPRRLHATRFTDAEWAEIKAGAEAQGGTISDLIRSASLARARQSVPVPTCEQLTAKYGWPPPSQDNAEHTKERAIFEARERQVSGRPSGVPIGVALDSMKQPLSDAIGDVAHGTCCWTSLDSGGDHAEYCRNRPATSRTGSPRQVFACAYCNAEFCTSFDAEAHIDNIHPDQVIS